MITEAEIYWITRLDGINVLFQVLCVIGAITTVLAIMFYTAVSKAEVCRFDEDNKMSKAEVCRFDEDNKMSKARTCSECSWGKLDQYNDDPERLDCLAPVPEWAYIHMEKMGMPSMVDPDSNFAEACMCFKKKATKPTPPKNIRYRDYSIKQYEVD